MKSIPDFPAFVDSSEVVEFVGKNHVSYRESWLRSYKKTQDVDKITVKPSLNMGALCAFPVWCAYRKLFLPFIFFMLAVSCIVVFEVFSGIVVNPVFYIALVPLFGMFANGLYLKRIIRFFENIDVDDPAERITKICKAGGTTYTGAVLGFAFFILFLVLVFNASVVLAETLGFDVSHVYV